MILLGRRITAFTSQSAKTPQTITPAIKPRTARTSRHRSSSRWSRNDVSFSSETYSPAGSSSFSRSNSSVASANCHGSVYIHFILARPARSPCGFGVERKTSAQLRHAPGDIPVDLPFSHGAQHLVNEPAHEIHLRFFHAAGREGGGADPDAAGDERALVVERHGVLVHRDPGFVEGLLGVLARQVPVPQVDEHEMVVRARGNDVVAQADEPRGKRSGVRDHLRSEE